MSRVSGAIMLAANPAGSTTGVTVDIDGPRPIKIMGVPVGAGAITAGSVQVQMSPNGTDWVDIGDPIAAANDLNAQIFDAPIKYVRVVTAVGYTRSGVVNYWAFN